MDKTESIQKLQIRLRASKTQEIFDAEVLEFLCHYMPVSETVKGFFDREKPVILNISDIFTNKSWADALVKSLEKFAAMPALTFYIELSEDRQRFRKILK
jgi:hypothetical protein